MGIISYLFPENDFKQKLRSILFRLFKTKDYYYYTKYKKIGSNDLVVDLGAYPGDFALNVAPHAKLVICFEADPTNFERLRKITRDVPNILCIPVAVWNKKTKLSISSDGVNSVVGTGNGNVNANTLDDELLKILKSLNAKNVDFIKMDIEGAEIEALQGMTKILKDYSPYLSIGSYHIRNNERTFIYVNNFLRKMGYKVKTKFAMPDIYSYAHKD